MLVEWTKSGCEWFGKYENHWIFVFYNLITQSLLLIEQNYLLSKITPSTSLAWASAHINMPGA